MTMYTLTLDYDQVEQIVREEMKEVLTNPAGVPKKVLKAAKVIGGYYSEAREWDQFLKSTKDWREEIQ